VRPELEKALALTRQFKEAEAGTPVIFSVHELKRPARNAAELMTLSAELQAGGIRLEPLTGPLTGIYDPKKGGASQAARVGQGVTFDAAARSLGVHRTVQAARPVRVHGRAPAPAARTEAACRPLERRGGRGGRTGPPLAPGAPPGG
jgi:hypothetical protein